MDEKTLSAMLCSSGKCHHSARQKHLFCSCSNSGKFQLKGEMFYACFPKFSKSLKGAQRACKVLMGFLWVQGTPKGFKGFLRTLLRVSKGFRGYYWPMMGKGLLRVTKGFQGSHGPLMGFKGLKRVLGGF